MNGKKAKQLRRIAGKGKTEYMLVPRTGKLLVKGKVIDQINVGKLTEEERNSAQVLFAGQLVMKDCPRKEYKKFKKSLSTNG